MTLLIFYLVLAIGVSFVCSLCEAVLLTLTVSDAEVLARSGDRAGRTLRRYKQEIDRPLAAILTLNTVSHTIGAAGVGAQAIVVFGSAWVGATSAVLTVLILVVSEIIPKTIGATKARPLARTATWTIAVMVWLTYPIVVVLDRLSRLLRGGHEAGHLTREQIEVIAEMARSGDVLQPAESRLLTNLLRLQQIRVEEILTPRTVMATLSRSATVGEVLDHDAMTFTRLPVTGDGIDDIIGFVLKHDIHRAAIDGKHDASIDSMLRPIGVVPESADLVSLMEQFGETGRQLFIVVDEYGGTAGLVTLEDVLESIIGAEIVDETDPVTDMRQLAERGRRDDGPSVRSADPVSHEAETETEIRDDGRIDLDGGFPWFQPDQIVRVAGILGRKPFYIDADGYECEIFAAAVHPDGQRFVYMEMRAALIPSSRFDVDITAKIHYVAVDGTALAVDIETHNPFFGCYVAMLEWADDEGAIIVYHEKHHRYVYRVGDMWPPPFAKIGYRWQIQEGVLYSVDDSNDRVVERLRVPSLEPMSPITNAEAERLGQLPPDPVW